MKRPGLLLVLLLPLLFGCLIARSATKQSLAEEKFSPAAYVDLPPLELWGKANLVDEPQGAYYSLGLTLGHLGHDPIYISRFHVFLEADQIEPTSLIPKSSPPETTCRILIEPENLSKEQMPAWGWQKSDKFIIGASADEGPSISLPLRVPKAGLYRIGIRFEAQKGMTGVTGLKLYAKGRESNGPLLADEFYNQPPAVSGLTWHELMADLEAGDYTITLHPVLRGGWHAPHETGYGPRKIDCIYLSDEIWAGMPDVQALEVIHRTGKQDGIQWTLQPAFNAKDADLWRKWQVRPIDWEQAPANPKLFEASYRFWRVEVDAMASNPKSNGYDYRDPHRQIVFDDTWNLLGNPWRIAQQINALQGDVRADIQPQVYHMINAARIDERTGGKACDWWPDGDKLVSGTYYNFGGEALYYQEVEPGHTYHFWVQFRRMMNLFEPWQMWASWDGNPTNEIYFKRDKRADEYPADIEPQRAWVKVGVIEVPPQQDNQFISWRVANLPWNGLQGVSYRWIYAFLITDDANFTPKGHVMPPGSLPDYQQRAVGLGATTNDGYMCQFASPSPLGQDWWPGPISRVENNTLAMTPDGYQSSQLALRSLVEESIAIKVECGPLSGHGKRYTNAIDWRVVAYTPYGATRVTWTGWALLRRPYITVPPLNVAALWLTVNTAGVKPGDYKAVINLTAQGRNSGKRYPSRQAMLNVHVSPVKNQPATPILVHGYTMPPEGEAYLADYAAHGLNVWCGNPIGKEEMNKRGMLCQQIRARASNGDYRPLMKRIDELGLAPDDYYLIVWDEPCGATANELAKFIGASESIHNLNPASRRAFNPGEPATLATFQVLDPYCDIWMPYERHFVYHPNEAAAKSKIITSKPWMDYSTPCYFDKEPNAPGILSAQIRRIPANPGSCIGTWFFALYYPFRDPWDSENEFLGDTSVFILPSRHGPVATMTWEVIRDAIQHADLAQMVKEKAAPDDQAAKELVRSGSVATLLKWLEKN